MIHITATDAHGESRAVKTLTSEHGDQVHFHVNPGNWSAWHTNDEAQTNNLTQNTLTTAALRMYAFAKVDALRVDYANGSSALDRAGASVVYPASQWPVLTVTSDLFDQPNT